MTARTYSTPNLLTTIIRVKSLALTINVVSTTPVQTVASTEALKSYVPTIAEMYSVMRPCWKGPDTHDRTEATLLAEHKSPACASVGSKLEDGVTTAVGTSCNGSIISFGDWTEASGAKIIKWRHVLLSRTTPVTKLHMMEER